MTTTLTPRFRFGIPDFNTGPWHGDFAALIQHIDSTLYNVAITANANTWVNTRAYVVGSVVISPQDGTMWVCAVAHTSAASPTTFSADRLAHPTFWNPVSDSLASETQAGIIELATTAETVTGTDNVRATHPAGVKAAIIDAFTKKTTLYAVDFGIVVGDAANETVNNNAFAAITTAFGTGGKKLVLPAGIIRYSTEWDMSNLINIVVEGQGGSDQTYSGTKGTVLKFTGTGSGNAISIKEHRGHCWRDLQVVYTSNSFTGLLFHGATTFTNGCSTRFENVQCYQVTNSGKTAGGCFYLKNNVDVCFVNCIVAHASYGWIGALAGEASGVNAIRVIGGMSIALTAAGVINPLIGFSFISHVFEPLASGEAAAAVITGANTVQNWSCTDCIFADAAVAATGYWINFGDVFGFSIVGGACLGLTGSGAGGFKFSAGASSGVQISGVLFSSLANGINVNGATIGAQITGNTFPNVTNKIVNPGNLDAGSVVLGNNPASVNLGLTIPGQFTSTSPTAGVGYAVGAGGTVTQATSKSTAVTLNKITGQITMNGATLNAGANVTFTVNNSTVATTDLIIVNHDSVGGLGNYVASVNGVGSGTFNITVQNISVANLGEAIVISFAVIKAVAT